MLFDSIIRFISVIYSYSFFEAYSSINSSDKTLDKVACMMYNYKMSQGVRKRQLKQLLVYNRIIQGTISTD